MREKRCGGFPSFCCQQAVNLEFTGADRQAVQSAKKMSDDVQGTSPDKKNPTGPRRARPCRQDLQLDCGHVAVETVLRKTQPQQLVTLESTHVLVNLLELGRGGLVLRKHFHGRLEAGIHDFLWKCLELSLVGHQFLQGSLVERIV